MKELQDELEDSRIEEFKKKGVKYYGDQKAHHARFPKCLEHRIILVYASGLMTDVIIADGQRLQETFLLMSGYFNVRVWSDGDAGKIPLPHYGSLWTHQSYSLLCLWPSFYITKLYFYFIFKLK